MKSVLPLPPDLKPKPKMGRNKPCWCGSGRKWKNCHKDREASAQPNYFNTLRVMDEEFRRGYCSHPEAPNHCSGRAIRSHTVQKRGGLRAIAENGHVMSAKGEKNTLHKTGGRITPQLTGVNGASTFMGFCGQHDNSLFRPLDVGQIKADPQCAFLLYFKAISYELFTKRAGIEAIKHVRDIDAGLSIFEQAALQSELAAAIYGMESAAMELEALKVSLDKRFLTQDYRGINMVVTAFEPPIPVTANFVFPPEFDFHGNRLQSIMDVPLDVMAFDLTVTEGRSQASFVWEGVSGSVCDHFAKSFESLQDIDKASCLFAMCCSHSENWHARPSWWNGLSPNISQQVKFLMMRGMPIASGQRRPNDLLATRVPVNIPSLPVFQDQLVA